MNKKLQNEIRAFIGNAPAQAIERVRTNPRHAVSYSGATVRNRSAPLAYPGDHAFIEIYGLAAYGAGLAAVMAIP